MHMKIFSLFLLSSFSLSHFWLDHISFVCLERQEERNRPKKSNNKHTHKRYQKNSSMQHVMMRWRQHWYCDSLKHSKTEFRHYKILIRSQNWYGTVRALWARRIIILHTQWTAYTFVLIIIVIMFTHRATKKIKKKYENMRGFMCVCALATILTDENKTNQKTQKKEKKGNENIDRNE